MDKTTIKNYFEKKIFYIQTELIKDFLFSLLDKVDRTYLGDDIMTIDNKKDHFSWCFNETISLFSKEEILFKKTKDFEEKLFDIFTKYYYSLKKNKPNLDNMKTRFNSNINCSTAKTVTQIEEVVWYHKLFQDNLGSKAL